MPAAVGAAPGTASLLKQGGFFAHLNWIVIYSYFNI